MSDEEFGLATSEREIFARIIASDGMPSSDGPSLISDSGGIGDATSSAVEPVTSWNRTNGEYLVVWSADDTDTLGIVDNEFEIFGQRVDRAIEAIPLDLSNALNVDVIVNGSGADVDTDQTPIDGENRAFVTDAHAKSHSTTGNGLPDEGVIPATQFSPEFHLHYTDADSGRNAVLLDDESDSFTVDLGGVPYRDIHFAVAASSAPSTQIRLEVEFVNGSRLFTGKRVDSWRPFPGGPTPSESRHRLVEGLDIGSADGTGVENVNSAVLHGVKFDISSSNPIARMTIRKSDGPKLFVFGAAGVLRDERDFVVTTLDDEIDGNVDPGDLSLREAIEMAQIDVVNRRIVFDPALFDSTMELQLGQLNIDGHVIIDGPGADRLTIDAASRSRIFEVASPSRTYINGLSLVNGAADQGGTILNSDRLTLSGVAIRESDATTSGGAILNLPDGDLRIFESEFSRNAAMFGGAISSRGELFVANSTFSSNFATRNGGAIDNNSNENEFLIVNSTITGNYADADSNGTGFGGGIRTQESSRVQIRNTVIAGNRQGAFTPDDLVGNLPLTTEQASIFNLIGVDTGFTGLVNDTFGNQIGTVADPLDPMLGPLADNGGPTRTHALLENSPAVDRGSNHVAVNSHGDPLTRDQRGIGFARTFDGDADSTLTIDIGAFELQAVNPFHNALLPGDANVDGQVSAIDALMIVNDLSLEGARELDSIVDSLLRKIDVNDDGRISSLDALLVINELSRGSAVADIGNLSSARLSALPLTSVLSFDDDQDESQLGVIDHVFAGLV